MADGRTRDRCPGRVGDCSNDGRFLSHGLSGENQENGGEEKREARAAAFQSWNETPGKRGREDCHVKPPNLLVAIRTSRAN